MSVSGDGSTLLRSMMYHRAITTGKPLVTYMRHLMTDVGSAGANKSTEQR